jgi:hypothetical protein
VPRSEKPTVPAAFNPGQPVVHELRLGRRVSYPAVDGKLARVTRREWSPGDYRNCGSWTYFVTFGGVLEFGFGEGDLRPARPDELAADATSSLVCQLANHVDRMTDIVRGIVTQEYDDVCWLDVYRQLAVWAGEPFEPRVIPRGKMLANCERFVDSLLSGCPYEKDTETLVIEEHHRTKRLLRDAGFGVTGTPLLDTVKEVLAELAELREFKEEMRQRSIEEDFQQ